MGYYSDVGLVVVLKDWDDLQEVLAVYKMHPNVQREDVFKHWTIYEREFDPNDSEYPRYCMMEYKTTYVKWYDEFDDVQAFRQLFTIVEQFGKERDGFKYAYREIAVGEDGATNEDEGENCKKLGFVCWERMRVEPAQIKFDNGDFFKPYKEIKEGIDG